MKFRVLSILTLLLICLTVLSFTFESTSKSRSRTHVRNKFKNKMRSHSKNKLHSKHYSGKATTVMSLLSSMGISSKHKSGAPGQKKKKKMTMEKKESVARMWNSTKIIENWMSISSKNFQDKSKFPTIFLPNGDRTDIKCDDDMFRINDAFFFNSTISQTTERPPAKTALYFRLSGRHIYYSATPSDYNILGAINIKTIETVGPIGNGITGNGLWCIKVTDFEEQQWRICSKDEIIRKQWLCRIQFILELSLDNSCYSGIIDDEYEPDKIEKHVIKPIILIPIPSRFCNQDWNYQKNGEDWDCDCKDGREQTPINLPTIDKSIDSRVKPLFQYEEVATQVTNSNSAGQTTSTSSLSIELIDATLVIRHPNFGRIITNDGTVYQAYEIRIHTPAEHRINYKRYDMEIQIIHQGKTVGDIAKQVVLSFLFEKKAGATNKFLDNIDFFNLPSHLNPKVDLTEKLNINSLFYSSPVKGKEEATVSKPFSFYTYQGSLPFPPCTESTIVYVVSQPMRIGTTALTLFKEALRIPDLKDRDGNIIVSNWRSVNNRKEQDRNNRPVYHYDHTKYCNLNEILPLDKEQGHYEKLVQKVNKYIYVNSQYPSGIPNSYVVSSNEAQGIHPIFPENKVS
jgi:carbonic anhydrase